MLSKLFSTLTFGVDVKTEEQSSCTATDASCFKYTKMVRWPKNWTIFTIR